MTEKKTARKGTQRKAAKPKAARTMRITLLRSPIGETFRHKATIRALGLRRIRQTVEQADTPQLRGMLAKVGHLVRVEAGMGKEKSS
jgi:large subunit ribosomal protein L30